MSATPRPTASCGCGYDLVWINGAWEHDAAPSLWGGDHEPDAGEPDDVEARKFWDIEDGVARSIPVMKVPPLQMDVNGSYEGDAYPRQEEYRIHMTASRLPQVDEEEQNFLLSIEDSSGNEVRETLTITAAEVDGILKVASTEHSLAVYEDDWKIPSGIERTLAWDLGTGDTSIVLSAGHIDEIASWLRFATGEEEWDGGDEWEY